MQVKKQPLELDMEQQTGSKLGKEYVKAVYCHTAYNLYAEYIMLGWLKHKLESTLPGEISIFLQIDQYFNQISIISDTQMTPPLRQKVKN